LKQSGVLVRVPQDSLVPGRSPTIDVVSKDQWFVTKISSDPYMPVRQGTIDRRRPRLTR
jgi:hypothetical protein